MRRHHFNPFRMRALRERAGMSRPELGRVLGYKEDQGRNVVWRLETAQVEKPYSRTVKAIADALGVDDRLLVTNPRDWFDCEAATLEFDSEGVGGSLYEYLADAVPLEGW